MVFTLHRYIFKDLLRIFLLATSVLSTMLSLGIMLRPLREFGVDPLGVPELLLCTLPMTLTMVMPIAALLAATLTYGRLAVENEINACRSSGIGLLTLIYPGLTLALLVGMTSLLLVFHVIPSYTKRFEEIIQVDAESMIYRNIDSKGHLGRLLPGVMLYADKADPVNHRLLGVVAVRYSKNSIEQIVTAREVAIRIDPGEDNSRIMLRFLDAAIVDAAAEYTTKEQTLWADIPSMWKDNVKFKKLSDLQAIREDLLLFKPIQEELNSYRQQFIAERCFAYYGERLAQQGFFELTHFQQRLLVTAEAMEIKEPKRKKERSAIGGVLSSAELVGSGQSPVSVLSFPTLFAQEPDKKYVAQKARLQMNLTPSHPQMILTLEQTQWHYTQGAVNQTPVHYLERYSFPMLDFPASLIVNAEEITLSKLLTQGPGLGLLNPSMTLQHLYQRLEALCQDVRLAIAMELHTRLAFGVSCVVLVLLGAALGIVFKSGHLLTAFGISFVPAALCLITIFTGKHIAEQGSHLIVSGICFLWSGIVLVGIVNFIVYRRLLKH